jgi:hypothetical protein
MASTITTTHKDNTRHNSVLKNDSNYDNTTAGAANAATFPTTTTTTNNNNNNSVEFKMFAYINSSMTIITIITIIIKILYFIMIIITQTLGVW